ncbi:hypothetical protein LEP1GSC016_3932 [Leptospira borgpetersenii serovar Hardjo-bovis str. Sponselee]|uniref:Uncharacterized protein n=1 Tax=Leptospira borgpetersenii serovar Hardjo-bovis str. Sponselee TaxID=1303729 RepID=M6BDG6_LEPBO|nr:hypothetical protein [Leptospira borgpetersenii]EMJ77559.1 hypothetical protein LEP1GSC016_3932 [Leptospira borgpetersenii serovar Hardjo-bovis str. Sponselee]
MKQFKFLVLLILLGFLNVSILAQSQNPKYDSNSKDDSSPEWTARW